MKKFFLIIGIALFLVSCDNKDLKKLQQENDSLTMVNAKAQAEFDEMLATLNMIEDGFKQIKESENYLTVQANNKGDIDASTQSKLKSDMELISNTLIKNKEELSKLQDKLKNSQYKSAEMKKTITRLTNEIETKSQMIYALQEDLAKRDIRIQELDDAVNQLHGQVNNLSEETAKQKSTISSQDKEINTVWFVFGTKKELKEHNIISGGGLFKSTKVLDDDFDKSYFKKEDRRTLKQIPLFAEKAKVLSTHPEDSYSFVKDEKNESNKKENLTLVINDPDKFWSLSKYLVIQVY